MQNGRSRRHSSSERFTDCFLERSIHESEDDSAMSPSYVSPQSLSVPVNYIEHLVSKMDTLAGVAIKYGVEAGDIKRMNGLVTDLQMFALKSLRIPLPGRHPPSSPLSNGPVSMGESSNEQTRTHGPLINGLESVRPLKLKPPHPRVSSAMKNLQGYYGLIPSNNKVTPEGTEMVVYKVTADLLDAEQLPKTSPISEPLPAQRHSSRSLVNVTQRENGKPFEGLLLSNAGNGELERSSDFLGIRQKADVDHASLTPELILKEENTSGGLSGRMGKGLALRPKSASRIGLVADAESGQLNPIPFNESISLTDAFSGVRKSSSSSNLQPSDNGTSSLWPTTKWSLKPDLQALSTAAITRPIFDGLPNPITGKRNKAALD